jgi:hypothetical protein
LKLHAANCLGCLLGIVYSAVIHVNLHVLRMPVSNPVIAFFIDCFEYRVDQVLLIIYLPPGKYGSFINLLAVTNIAFIDSFEAIVRDTLGTISDRSCANIAED